MTQPLSPTTQAPSKLGRAVLQVGLLYLLASLSGLWQSLIVHGAAFAVAATVGFWISLRVLLRQGAKPASFTSALFYSLHLLNLLLTFILVVFVLLEVCL